MRLRCRNRMAWCGCCVFWSSLRHILGGKKTHPRVGVVVEFQVLPAVAFGKIIGGNSRRPSEGVAFEADALMALPSSSLKASLA